MKRMRVLGISVVLGLGSGFSYAQEPDVKETNQYFQDWQLKCVEQSEDKQCNAVQILRDGQGQTAAMVNVAKIDENVIIEFAMPLLLDLTQGAQLKIDAVDFATYPFNACSPVACFVVRENDEELLNGFRNGDSANFDLQTFQGQKVDLNISLNGFSAVMSALEVELGTLQAE